VGSWCRGGWRWFCSALSRSAGPRKHKRALCDIHAPFPPAHNRRLPAAVLSDYLFPTTAPDKEKAVESITFNRLGTHPSRSMRFVPHRILRALHLAGLCWCGRWWFYSLLSRSTGPLRHKRALCDIHATFPPAHNRRLPAAVLSDYLFPTTAPDKEKAVKVENLNRPGMASCQA
jgi:hypothetical protein